MPDHSHLDSRYFIDDKIYNCPFCNRRHVSYHLTGKSSFDWTEKKKCFTYFACCDSCGSKSMHLSFSDISIGETGMNSRRYRFSSSDIKTLVDKQLDSAMFYSVPTSFFALDDNIPRILRDLFVEAQGCLKSNYLTGASICARKIVYELGVLSKATGENYEDRIKSLKDIHPEVDASFFDTLLTIQQLTSTKVHENSYDGWESKHLRVILSALSEVLQEIYVVPALRGKRRQEILKLKEALSPKPASVEPTTPLSQADGTEPG